jgi:hypothetical protein
LGVKRKIWLLSLPDDIDKKAELWIAAMLVKWLDVRIFLDSRL